MLRPHQVLQAGVSSGRSLAQAVSPSPGTVRVTRLGLFATAPGWLSWLPWHQGHFALLPPRKTPRPTSLPALTPAHLLCLSAGFLGMHSLWLADLPSPPSRAPTLALRSPVVWGKEGVSWLLSALSTAALVICLPRPRQGLELLPVTVSLLLQELCSLSPGRLPGELCPAQLLSPWSVPAEERGLFW